jgi:prophage regulatory protein
MVNTIFYRLPEVSKITGLSRSSIYLYVSRGDLPRPIKLGGDQSRAIGWPSNEIDAWIASRTNTSVSGV